MNRQNKMNIVRLECGDVRIAPVTNTLTDIDYVSELVEYVLNEMVEGSYSNISVYGYDLLVEDGSLVLRDTIVEKGKRSKSYRTVVKDISKFKNRMNKKIKDLSLKGAVGNE